MSKKSYYSKLYYAIFFNKFNLLVFFFIPFISFSTVKFSQLYSLNLNVADFGYFINHFEYLYNDPKRLILGHFQPSLLFFKLFYDIGELWGIGIHAILIVETLILAISVYFSKYFFGPICSILLFLHPSLWSFLIFDFHIDVLILPLILFSILFINKGIHNLSLILCFCTLLVKEVYLLIGFGLAMYGLITYWDNKKLRFSYFFTGIVCVIILFFIRFYLIYTPGVQAGEVLKNLNNIVSWSHVNFTIDLVYKKIKFLFIILGPCIFLSLFAYRYLIIIIPLATVYLISSNEAHFNPYAHYGLALCLPLCISLSKGLCKIITNYGFNKPVSYITLLLISLGFHMLITGSPISRLFYSDKTEAFNYRSYFPSSDRVNIEKSIKQVNLSGKAVSVQNNSYLPALKDAEYLFLFPRGVPLRKVPEKFTETFNLGFADYVLLDASKVPFIEDVGCNRIYMKCINQELENEYGFYLRRMLEQHKVLFNFGEIYFFKVVK